jgi:O-antigen/teichoic acid export membrane protein
VTVRSVGVLDAAGKPELARVLISRIRRVALVAGLMVGLFFAAPSVLWSELFNTESAWLFVILGAGMPFYIVQAVGRGALQGRLQFRRVGVTYLIEMAVRLLLGYGLVLAGGGVIGATIGLSVSFVAAWLAVGLLTRTRGAMTPASIEGIDFHDVRSYAALVVVLLVGQIIINNSDVLVAKAVLSDFDAGIYSAVALAGRAVYFLSWSVATVIFPLAARRQATQGETGSLLTGGIITVASIGVAATVGAYFVGGPVMGIVIGPDYANVSEPLAAYAAVTTMFVVANLIATHRLSQGYVRESWIVVGGAVVQVIALLIWNTDITSLIFAQAGAMAMLLIAIVTAQYWRRTRVATDTTRSVVA